MAKSRAQLEADIKKLGLKPEVEQALLDIEREVRASYEEALVDFEFLAKSIEQMKEAHEKKLEEYRGQDDFSLTMFLGRQIDTLFNTSEQITHILKKSGYKLRDEEADTRD